MKKRVISIMLAMIVAIAYSVPCFAIEDSAAQSESVIDIEELEENKADEVDKMSEFVDEVDQLLEYNEDEILTDSIDIAYLSEKYGENIVISMLDNIDSINDMAEEGDIEITGNGTIYDADDDMLYVQGSLNQDSSQAKWYGCFVKKSYDKANSLKKKMKNVNIATGLAALIAVNPETFLASAILGAISAYAGEWVKSIDRYNKKNKGIKYRLYWIGAYQMRTQGDSF